MPCGYFKEKDFDVSWITQVRCQVWSRSLRNKALSNAFLQCTRTAIPLIRTHHCVVAACTLQMAPTVQQQRNEVKGDHMRSNYRILLCDVSISDNEREGICFIKHKNAYPKTEQSSKVSTRHQIL